MMNDRTIDLLRLLRKQSVGTSPSAGLLVVKALTSTSLKFEGTKQALDLDIFEIPDTLQPLQEGATYFALPLAGAGDSLRWAIIQKLRGV